MNKEQRRIKAENHYSYTKDAFNYETELTVRNSEVYDETFNYQYLNTGKYPKVIVDNITSENAIKKYCKTSESAVLNFASFTRPGGGFLSGAIAQEEALCHSSNLYECLTPFTNLYDENYKCHMNNGLYKDWAIWSPDVCFIYNENTTREEIVECNVITCAAPNFSSYISKKSKTFGNIMNYDDVLKNRCKFILNISEYYGVKTLILGAFGCGVFENNPETVAQIFKELLETNHYNFDTVVFAIPEKIVINGKKGNLEAFKKIYE